MAVKNPGFSKKKNALKKGDKRSFMLIAGISIMVVFAIYAIVFAALFSIRFYQVHTQNAKRKSVLANPLVTSGVITQVHNTRYNHKADFIFYADNAAWKGETFRSYTGSPGDSVCVKYNRLDPSVNIYCLDAQMGSLKKDVLQSSTTAAVFFTALMVLLILLAILREKLNARKKSFRLP